MAFGYVFLCVFFCFFFRNFKIFVVYLKKLILGIKKPGYLVHHRSPFETVIPNKFCFKMYKFFHNFVFV